MVIPTVNLIHKKKMFKGLILEKIEEDKNGSYYILNNGEKIKIKRDWFNEKIMEAIIEHRIKQTK